MAIDQHNAPYVITKPLHHTQRIVNTFSQGVEVTIEVVINLEVEREILGFGDSITVLKPKSLRERIQKKMELALLKYSLVKGE